ncbi:MAG: carboxypeptidase-like regulatory domain-containing protein [Gammaproteobacteria bacterium]|nr:carboxypeptidase-like regulatory domain-containing protein [Gammaproteobacteria bacterium]
MAGYRKLLIVSPIVLVAIVIALYSQQLVDFNPKQNQPVTVVPRAERAIQNQTSSQNIPPANSNREVQSAIEDQLITQDSQKITPAIENLTLSGWVGTEFGENISGETVVLYSSYLRKHYSIITSSSGEFIFTDLKPSFDYALKVSPRGMFKRYSKFPISLRSDQEVHNIVLESIPLGILSGRIADPYGRPVAGIELFIRTVEIDIWSTNVITDANGSFSVAEFPKGRFQLAINAQQSLRATELNFDPDAVEPVNLTIDIGPYNLSGRIYDESGQTFDGAQVFLNWAIKENDVRIRSTRQVSADASGEFRFTGLGPGDHEVVVSAWRDDAAGQTIKQTVRQTVNVGIDPGELDIFFNTTFD